MSPTLPSFFEVDRKGLAQILERRGKAFVIAELWQNARDENVSRVEINLTSSGGRATLSVIDDSPDGWRDLRDAFTLFRPSYKKGDPTKAGRFNLGEKLVLAICDTATIKTTTGTITFDASGRSQHPRRKTKQGSEFHAIVRMTKADVAEAESLVRSLLVPPEISLWFNGEPVPTRLPVGGFTETLPTEIADGDGNLKPTRRMTEVDIYEPLDGETGTLYELGIPVVETGDRWHVNVQQKVPVSLDRTGLITPGYLRDVRAYVLNRMASRLSGAETTALWVDDALEDPNVDPAAVATIVTERYGDDAVVYDPSDHEANRIAVSKGLTVIPSAAFSRAAWKNVRAAEVALPAGRVTPSAQPYHPDGKPLTTIETWTPEMAALARYFERFAIVTLHRKIAVRFVDEPEWGFRATYGPTNGLVWNVSSAPMQGGVELDDLLIHELAHERGGHLTAEYDRALSQIGARAVQAAREGKV